MKRYYFCTNPLGPSRKVKAAVRKALKSVNTLPDEGLARLERLFLSKYGVGRESLLLANSLNDLLFLICRRLQPRKILIVGPALNIYHEAARTSGAVIESICGREESFFLPDMSTLVAKSEKSDLVIMANPNRITGKAISSAVLTQVFAALSMKNCITVVDEALIEFTGDEGCIRRAAGSSNIIVLRTTACYFGLPGLELAWAVAGPKLIESLRRGLHSDPSTPAIESARTALRDRSYRRLSDLFMREEKILLRKAVSNTQGMVMFDSDANIYLLKAADLAAKIARKAEQAGLAVQSCSDIDGLDDAFLRISVMKHEHNLQLARMLKGISIEKTAKKGSRE